MEYSVDLIKSMADIFSDYNYMSEIFSDFIVKTANYLILRGDISNLMPFRGNLSVIKHQSLYFRILAWFWHVP